MKEIKLSNGAITLVDDEDFEYLSQFKWHVCSKYYAGRHIYKADGTRTFLKMHNELMPGKEDGQLYVDHIDRNKLNNQRSNLRYSTASQNSFNRATRSKSGVRGVRFRPSRGVYEAAIFIDGKYKHLGSFPTLELASEAYSTACIAAPDAAFRVIDALP